MCLITENQDLGQHPGHQKGGDLDLVLDLGGLVIDVLDLAPGTDADILLALDPRRDGIERRRGNEDKRAFLRSKQKLPVFAVLHSG